MYDRAPEYLAVEQVWWDLEYRVKVLLNVEGLFVSNEIHRMIRLMTAI
jgi:hypothetical protein